MSEDLNNGKISLSEYNIKIEQNKKIYDEQMATLGRMTQYMGGADNLQLFEDDFIEK